MMDSDGPSSVLTQGHVGLSFDTVMSPPWRSVATRPLPPPLPPATGGHHSRGCCPHTPLAEEAVTSSCSLGLAQNVIQSTPDCSPMDHVSEQRSERSVLHSPAVAFMSPLSQLPQPLSSLPCSPPMLPPSGSSSGSGRLLKHIQQLPSSSRLGRRTATHDWPWGWLHREGETSHQWVRLPRCLHLPRRHNSRRIVQISVCMIPTSTTTTTTTGIVLS